MSNPKRATTSGQKQPPSKGLSGRRMAAGIAVVAAGALVASYVLSTPSSKAGSLSDLKQQTHYHGLAVDRTDPTRLLLATHHGFFVVNKDGTATRISVVQDFMGFTPHPTSRLLKF